MSDQIANHVLNWHGSDVEIEKGFLGGGGIGALAWFLAGEKFGVDEEAVFQIVDAESSGLTETDGAEMASDLEPMTVRGLGRRCELVGRDVHVGLERGCAFRDPIFDGSPGVLGVRELTHLQS